MDKIDNFRLRHPKIVIELIDLSTNTLIEKLQERKLDFVVDSTPIETVYNNIEPICSLSTCFVKSINNKNKITSLKSLENENIILPVTRSSLRKNLNKCFNEADVTINPILEFETELEFCIPRKDALDIYNSLLQKSKKRKKQKCQTYKGIARGESCGLR